MRIVVAVVASIVLAPLLVFFGLLAVFTLIEEVAAGWIDLEQATLTSLLNPAFWAGAQSPGGTATPLDILVGGPGGVGGTFGRYVIFFLSGMIAAGSFLGIRGAWRWAQSHNTTAGE